MPSPSTKHVPRISADIVDDGGDWSGLTDAEDRIQSAVDAVANAPGLLRAEQSVAVVLSTDAAVAKLNTAYRGKPVPTNVLSFPAGPGAPGAYLGDIVLAGETVAREAADEDITFAHHVQHLVVHGLLHLLGFDHIDPLDAERMEALEVEILQTLGIANPYAGDLLSSNVEP